ncbi:MAG TPA: MFS transporter [Nocardioidaceae bacterium]|nr:MFS transporter [Nocardioidaceae bacterium]
MTRETDQTGVATTRLTARGTSTARQAPLGPVFWVVWWSSTISFIGDGVFYGAVPLLAASLTRDARLVSLVDALTMSGWLCLCLVSGVAVDRRRKTGVMWRVDAVRAAIMVVFTALVVTGHATIGAVLLVSFAIGLASPFFDNASSAVLPEIVERGSLERANSWNQSSLLLCANLVGPPVGAALFVWHSGLPLGIQAASFVGAALLVSRVADAGHRPVADPTRSSTRELREGLRYLWDHELLRSLGLLLAVINGVTGGIVAIFVLFVLEVLLLPQAAYGWLVAAFAVGGLIGAYLAARVRAAIGVLGTVVGAALLFSLGAALLGLCPVLPVVVVAVVCTGLASVLWNVVTVSLRQRIVPKELLGRVTSVYRMVGMGASPIGAIGAGALAHATSIQDAYTVGAVVLLVAVAAFVPGVRRGLAAQPAELI